MNKSEKELCETRCANQAINYIKSNPCFICPINYDCQIQYKKTCGIWQKIYDTLHDIKEIK